MPDHETSPYKIAFGFVCLACSGQGWGLQDGFDPLLHATVADSQGHVEAADLVPSCQPCVEVVESNEEVRSQGKRLALLLLAFNAIASFSPSCPGACPHSANLARAFLWRCAASWAGDSAQQAWRRSTEQIAMELTRCALFRAARAVLVSPAAHLFAPQQATAATQTPQQAVEVPLGLCGGAYCLNYKIDGQPFQAIADTGSPFLLIDGTCKQGQRSDWGCYKGAGRPTGLEDTYEEFGGEDVGVQWRAGDLVIGDNAVVVANATFGVVRTYEGKGGDGAVFLGLAKQRLRRIRPTMLEQTSVVSLHFSFLRRTLTFSRQPLIPPTFDAIKLIDLRQRGAPIATYACRVSRLLMNGEPLQLDRPVVAIIDTGTTGISISESLFCSSAMPPAVREARIEFSTERGRTSAIEASVRRKQRPSPFGDIPLLDLPSDAPENDAFPLIINPVNLPWFETDFGEEGLWRKREEAEARMDADLEPYKACEQRVSRWNKRPASKGAPLSRLDGLGERPHVIFVGLAFLWRRELTIDIDSKRLSIV